MPPRSVKPVAELACALQDAIVAGRAEVATELVKLLAIRRAALQIVTPKELHLDNGIKIRVHIEDQDSVGGHIFMSVHHSMSVRLLKQKIFQAIGFPPEVQQWIIGKHLAGNEDVLGDLVDLQPNMTLFLYLANVQNMGIPSQEQSQRYMNAGDSELVRESAQKPKMAPLVVSASSTNISKETTTSLTSAVRALPSRQVTEMQAEKPPTQAKPPQITKQDARRSRPLPNPPASANTWTEFRPHEHNQQRPLPVPPSSNIQNLTQTIKSPSAPQWPPELPTYDEAIHETLASYRPPQFTSQPICQFWICQNCTFAENMSNMDCLVCHSRRPEALRSSLRPN